MQINQFSQFIAHARSEGVVFFHSGLLDQETIASIGAVLRRRLQEEGASGTQSRKVFATFMEMAQNVLHYAAAGQPEGKFGALSVESDEQGYQVTCGNFMASDQVPRVRERLESVQGMSHELVRQAYRRQLASDDPDPDSKGAGLGLLTMAVSARQPIEFTFEEPAPDGTTFLFLKALI
jgi:two-component sensor histidine kinase